MTTAHLPSPAAGPDFPRTASPAVMAGIVAVHLLAVWGLLRLSALGPPQLEPQPLTVSLVSAPPPPLPPLAAPKPAPSLAPRPRLRPLLPPQPVPVPEVMSEQPTAAPATAPEPAPAPPSPQAASPTPLAALAPPAPPPTVVELTSTQIAFLREPQLVYPPLSVSRRESGTVVLRVRVDEHGQMQELRIERSSGHARLDAAALAAMRTARFKPYVYQGRPTAFVALKPMVFELT